MVLLQQIRQGNIHPPGLLPSLPYSSTRTNAAKSEEVNSAWKNPGLPGAAQTFNEARFAGCSLRNEGPGSDFRPPCPDPGPTARSSRQ